MKMGHKFEKCYVLASNGDLEGLDEESIIEYTKKYPMPKNKYYETHEEVAETIIATDNLLFLNIDTTPEFISWLETLISELI